MRTAGRRLPQHAEARLISHTLSAMSVPSRMIVSAMATGRSVHPKNSAAPIARQDRMNVARKEDDLPPCAFALDRYRKEVQHAAQIREAAERRDAHQMRNRLAKAQQRDRLHEELRSRKQPFVISSAETICRREKGSRNIVRQGGPYSIVSISVRATITSIDAASQTKKPA